MSAPKLYTEREAVLRERRAGATLRCNGMWAMAGEGSMHVSKYTGAEPCASCLREAADRFPLPKTTRPRVVTGCDGVAWRIVEGEIECRNPIGNRWLNAGRTTWAITPERVKLLGDLLANPTEECDADE